MEKKKYQKPKVDSVAIDATVSVLLMSVSYRHGPRYHHKHKPEQNTPFDDNPWTLN